MQAFNLQGAPMRWRAILCVLATSFLAFCIRMIEWPSWQNPEYSYAGQMLLATNDAYHWLAGAVGFGLAKGHPMAELLRGTAWLLDIAPANAAFWYPPALASLFAGLTAFWAWTLGGGACSLAAGLIASIAPGFLARTLMGYYDTDLVTLLFPLLMALGPALFCLKFLRRPILGAFFLRLQKQAAPMPAPRWAAILAIFGLVAFQSQAWHSVFPYLGRYDVAVFCVMTILLSPANCRRANFAYSLCYGFPAVAGWGGLIWPAIFYGGFFIAKKERVFRILLNPLILLALAALLAWFFAGGEIARAILDHAGAYMKRGVDAHGAGAEMLVYPSVAQSIIEVQDLSIAALFPYFHPWQEAAIAGLLGYCWLLYKKPATIFLLPLLVLALSSQKLGGRMVMFGAPVVALGLAVPVAFFAGHIGRKKRNLAATLCCLGLLGLMVAPYLDMIPALSHGPSLNRRHAQALERAGEITPKDAMLWLWWDFGYAAHYFARRQTIADGARHGGPSLYLPAAIFATDNARFGRQIMARAANSGPEAGDFFRGLNAEKAQALIDSLKRTDTPLITTRQGSQYVVASFETLRLGFWISNYGSWNFVERRGGGGALSILPQALSYRLKAGEVRLDEGGNIIFPTSINVFEETGLVTRNYVREWFDAHKNATKREAEAWLATRRNINFLLNRVTDEKIAADQTIYNSLLVQLLICDPRDPAIAPYFRLVYDNVFTRIWEALPGA